MSDRKLPMQPDVTTPSRQAAERSSSEIPWFISNALYGEGDLHHELAQRYPNQPLMSLFNTREISGRSGRALAILSTQDSAASLTFEIDSNGRGLQCAYSISSMLTLSFDLTHLTQQDCTGWLEQMGQENERPIILWGKHRWRSDYMVWSIKPHYANLYAFSPLHTEAAARLTPELTQRLLGWIAKWWNVTPPDESTSRVGGW
jgi:hypothetical protein